MGRLLSLFVRGAEGLEEAAHLLTHAEELVEGKGELAEESLRNLLGAPLEAAALRRQEDLHHALVAG
jgi:hypothetical protein